MNENIEEKLENISERLHKIELILSNESHQEKQVLDIDDVVKITGHSKAYMYRMTSEHRIPHYKRGKKLYFNRKEIEAWLLSNKIKSDEEIIAEAERYCFKH